MITLLDSQPIEVPSILPFNSSVSLSQYITDTSNENNCFQGILPEIVQCRPSLHFIYFSSLDATKSITHMKIWLSV